MTNYIMSNKEKKAIIEFDRVAKDSFPAFYVNSLCEAFAPLEIYKDRNAYSFVRDPECRLAFIFRAFNISNESVITIDHRVVAACMGKMAAVEGLETRTNKIYLRLTELKAENYKKVSDVVFEENNYFYVQLGEVRPFTGNILKTYELAVNNITDYSPMSDQDVEDILDKKELRVEDNGYELIVLKPLFPGINKKSTLSKKFIPFPNNDELFIANFLMIKEQIYSYHKYIGIIW